MENHRRLWKHNASFCLKRECALQPSAFGCEEFLQNRNLIIYPDSWSARPRSLLIVSQTVLLIRGCIKR